MTKTLKQRTDYVLDYFADKSLKEGLRFQLLNNWSNSDSPVNCVVMHVCEERSTGLVGRGRLIYYLKDYQNFALDSTMDYYLFGDKEKYKIIGKPVFIGDVLHKVSEIPRGDKFKFLDEVVHLWWRCGLSRSLNEIFDSEIASSQIRDDNDYECFKSAEVQALLEYLESIIPNN